MVRNPFSLSATAIRPAAPSILLRNHGPTFAARVRTGAASFVDQLARPDGAEKIITY